MLKLLIVSGRFLVLNQLESVVGYPWFSCLGGDMRESVPGCFFYSLCDRVSLGGRLSVSDFDEVEKVGVVSVVK